MTIKALLGIVAVAACIALGVWLAIPTSPEASSVQEGGPAAPPASWLSVEKPTRRAFHKDVALLGVVRSQDAVRLTALVDGQVSAIAAQDEEPLARGALVLRLAGALVEARRALLSAEEESLRSLVDVARTDVARTERKRAEGLATNEQLAASKTSFLKMQQNLREARATLLAFETKTEIRAPAAGVFTGRKVSVGQTVRAGEVVGEIVAPHKLRVEATLFPPPGTDVQGKDVRIRLGAHRSLKGVVSRILPRASSNGGTRVWIEGPEIDARLRPGQTVDGAVTVRAVASALSLPPSAIVYDTKERPIVFVRSGDGYERRAVTLGLQQDGRVEVAAGVEAKDEVVVAGAYELYYKSFNTQWRSQD